MEDGGRDTQEEKHGRGEKRRRREQKERGGGGGGGRGAGEQESRRRWRLRGDRDVTHDRADTCRAGDRGRREEIEENER